MHKSRICCILFLVILVSSLLSSQSRSNLPKVFPPSPVAATFTIYGDYPVSYNTGVPDIQIPLHTLQHGDINVPVTLKYHIGSAKPNPYGIETSNIGYGWILEAGGIVTRTVMGKQDESGGILPSRQSTEYNEMTAADYETLRQFSVGQLDSEHDIFSYDFSGQSGNFVIDKNNAGSYAAHIFPYKPWKFKFTTGLVYSTGLITAVSILDDMGYNWYFSDSESNNFMNTGWYLTRIESPRNRRVNFLYYPRRISVIPGGGLSTSIFTVTDNFIGENTALGIVPDAPGGQPLIDQNYQSGSFRFDTKTIREINCTSGKVVFNLNGDNARILDFVVYDGAGVQLKKVVFYQSAFPGQKEYIRLDSVVIRDADNKRFQTYSFLYNKNSVLNSNDVDYWGWYNGVSGSKRLPYTEFSYLFSSPRWDNGSEATRSLGETDRCANPEKILAQTLQKIVYPTGGTTEFIFEPNQYIGATSCSNDSYGNGLRIRSIINRDAENNVSERTYEYQQGFMPFDRFNPANYTQYSYSVNAYNNNIGSLNFGLPGFTFQRSRTFSENLNADILDNSIRYKTITEYIGNEYVNTGKTVYTYSYENPHQYKVFDLSPGRMIVPEYYRNWGNGLLVNTGIYMGVPGSDYIKVKEIQYRYNIFYDTLIHNLKVFRLSTYPTNIILGTKSFPDEFDGRRLTMEFAPSLPSPPIFGVYDYYIQTGVFLPVTVTETEYLPEAVTNVTNNYYENGFRKYLSRTEVNKGGPGSLQKTFKYPYEYSEPVYRAMVEKNRINNIIELTESRNESNEKTITNYSLWRDDITAPVTIQTSQNSRTPEDLVVFGDYDSYGNVLAVSKANDIVVSYIWGYNKSYPLAEIKGAYPDDVADCGADIKKLEKGDKQEQERLRKFMSGALITFYTYRPLVGMTSQTDPNGITIFYEYDSSGRLQMIRDNDGRILKTFDYNYGQK